jgi:beta-carotene hydroxylase
MRLRHPADVRTMIWAFVLLPAVAVGQYAGPSLAAWLTPFSFYFAYCAGVIAHNHNHCPTFRGRAANAVMSAWLSFFYGYPTFAWIPTHNANHHRFVNRPGDATATWRVTPRNGAFAALTFFFVSAAAQRPLIARFLGEARRRRPRAFALYLAEYVVVFAGHAAVWSLAIAMHGVALGSRVYLAAIGAPALGALWGLMFTNYVQHVDCDPWSPYDHSRNFVSPWMNWLVFDNGFHTAHHRHPGLHWSRLRAAHARMAPLIDPRLVEGSIVGYCSKAYVLSRLLPRRAPSPPGAHRGAASPPGSIDAPPRQHPHASIAGAPGPFATVSPHAHAQPTMRAGLPATTACGGTSPTTTAPAPTIAERPTRTGATSTAPAPMLAPSSTNVRSHDGART